MENAHTQCGSLLALSAPGFVNSLKYSGAKYILRFSGRPLAKARRSGRNRACSGVRL